jgi:hypothetical protein
MSAFAAEVMTCRSARLPLPSITARLSAAEKARFARLADAAGMSDSTLALMAIRTVLNPDGKSDPSSVPGADHEPASDRITIRLRPGDATVLARRAAQRGMRASTYLAAMARAHVAVNPPLATSELAALKQSVALLAGLGRTFVETSRKPALEGTDGDDLRKQLGQLRTAVAALEQRTHDLVRTALISWESRSG